MSIFQEMDQRDTKADGIVQNDKRNAVKAAEGGVLKTDCSPHCKLKSLSLSSVRWLPGFWGDVFNKCKDVTLEHLYELMVDPEQGHALTNLRIAAGMEDGEFSGTNWQDEWVYKWMEAASYIYDITRDEQLNVRMDEIIDIIGKAQEPDGYIATQIKLKGRKRFERKEFHELYVMGHLITAACIHHRATGKKDFLGIALRTADYLYNTFIGRDSALAHASFNPSNIMAVVELYRETGDKKYLELANVFIDMQGSSEGGTDMNQDRVPLREESEVVGHSVLSTYLYASAADIYMETGEKSLLEALKRLWLDLTGRKMYIHGGVCALHRGFSVRGSRHLDDVSESVGMEYELPNSTAYNETCAQIGNFMWNWRMLSIEPQPKYADIMERSIYNSILSGIDTEGKNWFYTNPLRWYGEEHHLLSQDAYRRFKPNKIHVCCPSNLLRTIASLHNYLYSVSEEGIWINLYSSNIFDGKLLDGTELKFRQETNYPWEGTIKLILENTPLSRFAIMARIPDWADEAVIKINGEQIDQSIIAGSYVALEKTWHKGDMVEIILPMKVRLMMGHPKIEAVRNQVAVVRGPMVYCLESCDLPEDIQPSEVYIPRDIKLTTKFEKQLLGGITVLEGEAKVIRRADWSSSLYREMDCGRWDPIKVKLIPYYAWNNRGISQMEVWMPLI